MTSEISPASSLRASLLGDRVEDDAGSDIPESPASSFLGNLRSLRREQADELEREREESRLQRLKWRAGAGAAAAATLFFLVPLLLLWNRPGGREPACRKSAGMALLPSTLPQYNSLRLGRGARANASGAGLLVWSGMAHGENLLDDALRFDLATRRWSRLSLKDSSGSGESSMGVGENAHKSPAARWKAGVGDLRQPGGMLVYGGDTRTAAEAALDAAGSYTDDVWLLTLPGLRWQKGELAGSQRRGGAVPGPGARRAHSAVVYDAGNGSSSVAVFGGRLENGTLMSDAWVGALAWPKVTWQPLPGPNPGAPRPGPRKGHVAVLRDNAPTPQMIVHGGRDAERYLGDVWILDLVSGAWEEIVPAPGSQLPAPRDHHGAALYRGRLLVFGGRSGPTYASSRPLKDVWSFDLWGTRQWTQALEYGLAPHPRFLFSYLVQPAAQAAVGQEEGGDNAPAQRAPAPRLLVFGGESLERCKLNDVWALDLHTLHWEELAHNVFCRRRCDKVFGGGGGGGKRRA